MVGCFVVASEKIFARAVVMVLILNGLLSRFFDNLLISLAIKRE